MPNAVRAGEDRDTFRDGKAASRLRSDRIVSADDERRFGWNGDFERKGRAGSFEKEEDPEWDVHALVDLQGLCQ